MNERFVHYNGKTYLVRRFCCTLAVGTFQGTFGDHGSHFRVDLYNR